MTPNSKLKQTHELGTLLGLWNHPVRRREVKTLVGYKDWMDSIAQLIGCEAVLVEETLGVASLKSFQFSASCFRKGLTPISSNIRLVTSRAWKSRCVLLLDTLLLFVVHFWIGGYHLRSGGQLLSI